MGGHDYICIHGHFYQPPRENPFTGVIEDEPDAAPYPNWNERINAECYRPNTSARVLDRDGLLLKKLSTYEWISFDFGPTLLAWLQAHDRQTYRAIVDADRSSAENHGGHGSAMAQAYNHSILPLANRRDKVTQVKWGVADFVHRFGRTPEGMWLPETAVDMESLGVLADQGIKFTILSPNQASAVRSTDGPWLDVSGGTVDTRRPYSVRLPGGESIAVFFYDGPLSTEIAFNGLLNDGRQFAKALKAGIGDPDGGPRLSHVATDGESYGHHHRFGEMALAAAIEVVRFDPEVSVTNYGEFLSMYPPTNEAQIREETSWSCAHGVERWRSDCGCAPQTHPEWDQAWRAPLRDALDWLRDALIPYFEGQGAEILDDPWAARDAYVEVLLGGSRKVFLDKHCRAHREAADRERALMMLEMQNRAMLMYTSCGWFFDDLDRLEGRYVLGHAGKAIELARECLGEDLEPGFVERLELARSNKGASGREIFERGVVPYLKPA